MATKIVSDKLKKKIRMCLENLPLTINTHFGDPFQPDQWENTLGKVKYLKDQGYKGELEVSTKWIISDEQIEELYDVNPDLWIICGITGINEVEDIPIEARYDNYLRICKRFRNTILNVRPLIPGINDSMEILTPIIEVAAKGRRLLKHGGYLNPQSFKNKKTKYDDLKKEIHALCEKLGVNDGPRCACIVTDVTGRVNSTFEEAAPVNLDVLEALGYDFDLRDGQIILTGYEGSKKVTKGDVSFARLIVESSHVDNNWDDPHVYMQMKGPDGQTMVCTSSWLHWAREVECMVNCFYCHVRPSNPIIESFEAGDTGCSPIDLYNYMFESQDKQ